MIYFWLLGIARESEQRPEKLSLKKQLKLKCLEQNPNPRQNIRTIGYIRNVTTATNGPSARFSVAGDCLDPFRSGVLIFIGGCNKSLEALDDMYYLYTGSAKCHLFATLLTFLMQPFLVLIFC